MVIFGKVYLLYLINIDTDHKINWEHSRVWADLQAVAAKVQTQQILQFSEFVLLRAGGIFEEKRGNNIKELKTVS
jgi:hypothetical protein